MFILIIKQVFQVAMEHGFMLQELRLEQKVGLIEIM